MLDNEESDWLLYLEMYPDLQNLGIRSIEKAKKHWIEKGKKEGRVLKNKVNFNPRISLEYLPGEIWGITTFFNPGGYKNKVKNYRKFRSSVKKQGLSLITVELAFGDVPFELDKDDAEILIQLRTSSKNVLWQKEAMLNVALEKLPSDCDKIVWLDSDILFMNNNWINETKELLNKYCVVQPFSTIVKLQKDAEDIEFNSIKIGLNEGEKYFSTPYLFEKFGVYPNRMTAGYVWAARRNIFDKIGFYDKLILGGGDTLTMCAFYDYKSLDPQNVFFNSWFTEDLKIDQEKWYQQIYEKVLGSVYYAEGVIYHLWHGSRNNRLYSGRNSLFKRFNFNPKKDLKKNKEGLLEWSSSKKEFHDSVSLYFLLRNEMGKKNIVEEKINPKTTQTFPVVLGGSFWGITTFFNPGGYKNKVKNYRKFRSSVKKQGLSLITVELAFGDVPFELDKDDAEILIQLRTSSKNVLWQKERLLNVALEKLPSDCDKIVWLDCDILFKNDNWINETAKLLEDYVVVQPFSYLIRLSKGKGQILNEKKCLFGDNENEKMHGAALGVAKLGKEILNFGFAKYGEESIAWAARREIFKDLEFPDRFLLSTAQLMLYSFYNYSPLFSPFQKNEKNYYSEWVKKIYPKIKGSVFYASGTVYHLWHGDHKYRRNQNVLNYFFPKDGSFNLKTDIKIGKNNEFCWATKKEMLHEAWAEYFLFRAESKILPELASYLAVKEKIPLHLSLPPSWVISEQNIPKMNEKLSVIISTAFKWAETQKIINYYASFDLISEIILVNNFKEEQLVKQSNKLKIINFNKKISPDVWVALTALTENNAILIQKDNILLRKESIAFLFNEYLKKPEVTHGDFAGSFIFNKKYVQSYFEKKELFEDLTKYLSEGVGEIILDYSIKKITREDNSKYNVIFTQFSGGFENRYNSQNDKILDIQLKKMIENQASAFILEGEERKITPREKFFCSIKYDCFKTKSKPLGFVNVLTKTTPKVIHAPGVSKYHSFWLDFGNTLFLDEKNKRFPKKITFIVPADGRKSVIEAYCEKFNLPLTKINSVEDLSDIETIKLIFEKIKDIKSEYVLFCSDPETIFANDFNKIPTEMKNFDCKMLFCAKQGVGEIPLKSIRLQEKISKKKYVWEFLDESLWIGKTDYLKKLFENILSLDLKKDGGSIKEKCTGELFSNLYIENYPVIKVDFECKIFQNIDIKKDCFGRQMCLNNHKKQLFHDYLVGENKNNVNILYTENLSTFDAKLLSDISFTKENIYLVYKKGKTKKLLEIYPWIKTIKISTNINHLDFLSAFKSFF